jgi:antitoxin VapB
LVYTLDKYHAQEFKMSSTSLATAKIFITGRSQAVRLPKAFRFTTTEATIERQGDAIILRPKLDAASWAEQLVGAVNAFSDEPKLARSQEWPQAEREPLLP